jgi:DNA-binding Xre family transcriptional regulator
MSPRLEAVRTLGGMVRLRIGKLLRDRKMTAYRLAKLAGLSVWAAYRLAAPGERNRRLDTTTIDKLCHALSCHPGDLFEYHR